MRYISPLRLLFMSQLLVTVFATSDWHNLLISEDASAAVKLRVSSGAAQKRYGATSSLSPASIQLQKMKLKRKGRQQAQPAVRLTE